MNKEDILKILEMAKDKNGEVPMRLVRQAFEKLPESCEDAVSRKKVFEYFVSLWECIGTIMDRNEWEDVCKTTANELPSAQPETYKEKLNEIASALSEKFAYMNTCLNERDIILGYLGVKRPNVCHCNTDCNNYRCESYHYDTKKYLELSDDTIRRQAAIDECNKRGAEHIGYAIAHLPSAQPERLTDDDFETIRIHLSIYKEKLCNQRRWKEAEEYQKIIDRFMSFASAQSELIRCKDCKHLYVDGENVRFNVCELNHNKVQNDDWFCADAERKEGEEG